MIASITEPLDNVREQAVAAASAGARSRISALQGLRIDDGGVGFDAPTQSGELRPARRIGELMKIEPPRNAD